MKQLVFTVLLLVLSWDSFSQEDFSFTLYFEDAIGNKDSLILGYDELATNGVDEEFGEENVILNDWNEPFEIRVTDEYRNRTANPSSDGIYHLKKEIVKKASNDDGFLHRITIDIMNIENWPVKTSWDSSLFEEEERNGSFITPFEYGQWVDLGTIEHFLAEKEELLIVNDYSDETVISFYKKNEIPIYTLWFVFYDESSRTINTKEALNHPFKVYPNPISSHEHLTIEFSGNYSIINNVGQIVQDGKVENNQITLDKVPKGSYFIVLENGNQLHKLKIVKL